MYLHGLGSFETYNGVSVTQCNAMGGSFQYGTPAQQKMYGNGTGTCMVSAPTPAPAPAPAPAANINVSTQVSPQISPQVSPNFVQQSNPTGSPVGITSAQQPTSTPSLAPTPTATPDYSGVYSAAQLQLEQQREAQLQAQIDALQQAQSTTPTSAAPTVPMVSTTSELQPTGASAPIDFSGYGAPTPTPTAAPVTALSGFEQYLPYIAGGAALLLFAVFMKKKGK